MPQINIFISKKLDENTKNLLQNDIADSMPAISGKSDKTLVCCIVDECNMYKIRQKVEYAFYDIRLLGVATHEDKEAFAKLIFDTTERIVNIPPEHVQLSFSEFNAWAVGGNYKKI